MEHAERMLLTLAGIFVLGVGAQWLAWQLRLPSILLLLAFGFAAGPGTGWLRPDEMFGELLFPIVSLSVGLILFEGSLGLKLKELRDVGRPLLRLLSIGVLVTWALGTLFSWWFLEFELPQALLLGALLTVTGPTVVGPLLRHIRPTGRISSIARWEGIVIDPIGAILAVLVFEVIEPLQNRAFADAAVEGLLGMLKSGIAGAGIGIVAAWLLISCLKRHLIPDRLQSPVTLMLVVAAFASSNLCQHEAGLITVTVMGVVIANQGNVSVKHILEFKENLTVLLISSLFILLAARVDLADFGVLGWSGPLFVLAMILVVRPLSVLVASAGTDLTRGERLFLAWLAPRGIVAAAVASVFAIRLGDDGTGLVPATFLVIVGTVVVYGLTAFPLAKKLGLASDDPQGILMASAHPGARAIAHAVKEAGFRVVLIDTNREHVNEARMEGLEACYANVLSEHAVDEIDLGGIGRFLAVTSNDEVNSLAARHFSELFGRKNVFQLSPGKSGPRRTAMGEEHLHGRFLFSSDATCEWLDDRFESNAIIKSTTLSQEFDYPAFRELYGDSALALLLVTETGRLEVLTEEAASEPAAGQKVIALVDVSPGPEQSPGLAERAERHDMEDDG